MKACETCGGTGETLFYRRDSDTERILCKAHARKVITAMHADGWLSQSAAVAMSATGRAIRQHLRGVHA
jgi:hypothetical protein